MNRSVFAVVFLTAALVTALFFLLRNSTFRLIFFAALALGLCCAVIFWLIRQCIAFIADIWRG